MLLLSEPWLEPLSYSHLICQLCTIQMLLIHISTKLRKHLSADVPISILQNLQSKITLAYIRIRLHRFTFHPSIIELQDRSFLFQLTQISETFAAPNKRSTPL
jgi:hypothetical protein